MSIVRLGYSRTTHWYQPYGMVQTISRRHINFDQVKYEVDPKINFLLSFVKTPLNFGLEKAFIVKLRPVFTVIFYCILECRLVTNRWHHKKLLFSR